MPLIKRYSNRKLYDTEAKQYITLEGIAGLIRQGQNVQVIDYASGEDLTAVTLTQIIFEQEKKQRGFLPRAILSDIVQVGGERLNQLQRNLVSQLSFLLPIEEEIKRRVQVLVRQGHLTEDEGANLLEKLLDPSAMSVSFLSSHMFPGETEVEMMLNRHNIPSRKDLERLTAQLDALAAELEQISKLQH
jgi:polyhydroxyalkanoate synthesis repressor PhaR